MHSLGPLPKRKPRSPVFHIHRDDDDDGSSSLDEPRPGSVPFPSSSPCTIPRGASAPILLANGKPLKPSLKSSSSSPSLTLPPMHLRAHSEPSTPATTQKTVHFPETDFALATVRVFNRKARPAALSSPVNGYGDETETEGEDTPPSRFPFPPPSYEIDTERSSSVPSARSPAVNLLLESFHLSSPAVKPCLAGSVLVRNLAFEKHVAIRFTLDDWQTVSEVSAHYLDSIPRLPSNISPTPAAVSPSGRGWDRFSFAIRLEDYALSLSTRTLFLVARYRVNSTYPDPGSTQYGPGGEWWDNNGGSNYCVAFKTAIVYTLRTRPRSGTVPASITSPRNQPQRPTTCREHALGLMIPSISNNKIAESPNEAVRKAVLMRAGKLDLCNYARPSSVSCPSASPSTTHAGPPPSVTSPDDSSTSPASSTLSTPSVSPTIPPRVIIGGQPATCQDSSAEDDVATNPSKPGYIANWDWSAPSTPRIDQLAQLARQRSGVAASDALPPRADNSLYNAFISQWCFAQGPSPSHNDYGGGIMV